MIKKMRRKYFYASVPLREILGKNSLMTLVGVLKRGSACLNPTSTAESRNAMCMVIMCEVLITLPPGAIFHFCGIRFKHFSQRAWSACLIRRQDIVSEITSPHCAHVIMVSILHLHSIVLPSILKSPKLGARVVYMWSFLLEFCTSIIGCVLNILKTMWMTFFQARQSYLNKFSFFMQIRNIFGAAIAQALS